MEDMKKEITCHSCKNVLRLPVTLSCGHSICKVHTFPSDQVVVCSQCGRSHENKELVINQQLMSLVTKIAAIDFGKQHAAAKEARDSVEAKLDRYKWYLRNTNSIVKSDCKSYKREVLNQSEYYKSLIDEITKKLCQDIDDYERKCRDNFKTAEFKSILSESEKFLDEQNAQLAAWSSTLNDLKMDPYKVKKILQEHGKVIESIDERKSKFYRSLYDDGLKRICSEITDYGKVELDKLFKLESTSIDSCILSMRKKKAFFVLCGSQFEPNRKKWKLVYRASRDGFGAADFHSKCDNICKTLTIVSANGRIFGGYTNMTWNAPNDESKNNIFKQFVKDPKGFVFSLSTPFLLRANEDGFCINRDPRKGPAFGAPTGFEICNQANVKNDSVSQLGFQFDFANGPFKWNDSLADDTHFLVQELEVFQLIHSE